MTDQRRRDLDRIRAAYADYDRTERGRLWDPANQGYARLSRDRDVRTASLLRACLSEGTTQVLDVGCGDGGMALVARAQGVAADIVGVDLVPERVARARERAPWATFVEASADALPFEDGSFAAATALTVFSSLPSSELEAAVAREIGRVLRPGGWLIWYDLRISNPRNPSVHGLSRARIAALFPGWRRDLRSITLAPPIARRLGPATPVLYPLLEAIPPLRTHLIGRLQCPT
jgi:ubiquinone/menaquinone biosynthesis C-methylase UbiE